MLNTRRSPVQWFLIPVILFAAAPFSQASVLTSTISARKLSVGDQLNYSINIVVPKNATVIPPTPETDFGSAAVLEWNSHKDEREKSDSLSYSYIVTTYTPETCTIPALPFIIENGTTTDTLRTEPLTLHLVSVINADTADLMGLKTPFSAGKAPQWWLWLLGSITGIALLIFGGIYLSRLLRKTPPPPPPVPPYEEAIEALSSLGLKKYLQRGLVREYVFELSEIFKRYIGRRFECNAVEYTTEEMIAWTGAMALDKKLRGTIDWFFRTTDPVKFARLIPDSATIDRFEQEVKTFLEATKPVIENSGTSPQENVESPDVQKTGTEPGEAS